MYHSFIQQANPYRLVIEDPALGIGMVVVVEGSSAVSAEAALREAEPQAHGWSLHSSSDEELVCGLTPMEFSESYPNISVGLLTPGGVAFMQPMIRSILARKKVLSNGKTVGDEVLRHIVRRVIFKWGL